MRTKIYLTSWKRLNMLLENWKPTTRIYWTQLAQLENSQWFEASPNWICANDAKLQQNGGIQYATIKYHNQFGANLSRVQGVIRQVVIHIELEKEQQTLTAQRSVWNS
jgi:hypothetical protein